MRRFCWIMRHSVACFALIVLLGGCGTPRENLIGKEPPAVENHTSGKVQVAWSETRVDGEGYVVAGVVKRNDTVGLPIHVTVHASIIASDGRVLGEAQSQDIRVPRRITSKVQGFQRFEVRFPARPPEGSSIHLAVRDS